MGFKILVVSTMLVSLMIQSSSVVAEDVYSEQFQTIQSVELVEIIEHSDGTIEELVISDQKTPQFIDTFGKNHNSVTKVNLGNILMVTKQLIALGKEIYKIVEAGKPVVKIVTEPVQVLPRNENGAVIEAMNLHDWHAPVVRKYRVSTKNYLGMKPASFEFFLIFSYGGQNNGSGRYITGAQIKPTSVDVKWGYKLDASFKVQSIMNEGSLESPVAGAVLMIDYKISTILQERRGNRTFYINGLGKITAY